MSKKVILIRVLCLSTLVALVSCGNHGKWMIKAKGKGMQNLISHGGGGGGGGGHYEHKEYKKPEVHYYPIPMHYGGGHKYGGYHGEGSHRHEVSIIPLYDNLGKNYGSKYGGYAKEDYGSYH